MIKRQNAGDFLKREGIISVSGGSWRERMKMFVLAAQVVEVVIFEE